MRPSRALVVACLIGLCVVSIAHADTIRVRSAVWAGRFYPEDPAELRTAISRLMDAAAESPVRKIESPGTLRAVVLPHAGYVYSGLSAAHGLHAIEPGSADKVIVVAPDHRVGMSRAAISLVDAYETPLGQIPLHPDAHQLRDQADLFSHSPASDRMEHSLEVLLPYLQERIGDFELVPVVVGSTDIRKMAERISGILDERTLLVISSDLSHYLAYDNAVSRDRDTLEAVRRLDTLGLMTGENRACGRVPLAVVMEIARARRWTPVLFHYSNSGDTAGSRDRVVGYAAIGFYEGGAMSSDKSNNVSEIAGGDGERLVELARHTIMKKLGRQPAPNDTTALEEALQKPVFDEPRGTFVTLTINGRLRGCIGSLVARRPVRDDVAHNAVNAAFHDPRFAPLAERELDRVHIEVSVLSEPEPLSYDTPEDLVAKLRPNVDGVILQQGGRRATFLPQVWSQLPTHDAFLGHLCQKAGLRESAWKDGDLDVYTYQVTYFEEPHP